MAAELVGGSFLSASLQVLFQRMASLEVNDFFHGNKVHEKLLKELKIVLLSANKVLNDAEMKQPTDTNVKQWLDELKDTIYNADDLVYEINTEALRCEMEGQSGSSKFQVLNFMPSRFTVNKFEQRMVDILDMLKSILEQKDLLGLREGVENKSSPRPVLPPLEEESDIYGRDADKESIIKLLLSDDDDADGNKISVIPIVGMGGIGKTTLAQLIYDDVRVNNFDIRAWITVSDQFDVFTLTKSIFESVTSQTCCVKDLYQLQLKLKEVLEGKKFLFVLDDIWNENYNLWYTLKSPFEFAARGSKIIVTTRSQDIASMMGNVPKHDLQILGVDDSWRLFTKHAFNNRDASEHPDLEVIGREIVKRCQGLPLAIKSLGGLLRSKVNLEEWEKILKNDIWRLDRKCDILPALWLSYYYLPPHLKRCFAYCSIFPKDYKFEMEKLILLWMAEDFLQPQQNKMPEEVGEEYFNDLTSRSFLKGNNVYGYYYTMHDLINDLANFVSGEFCLSLDNKYSKVLTGKARYLWCGNQHCFGELKDLSNENKVRTLLFDEPYEPNEACKRFLANPKNLQTMPCVRVLSLRRNPITTIVDWADKFKLLRYLDLSYTDIEELPDTICTMYNLQTLLLHYCKKLSKLPNSIGNLKHLRHLDLSLTDIKEIPETVCNLRSLCRLNMEFCKGLSRLPTNMSRLVNLRHLNLSGTPFREMPPHMSKLKHLQVLRKFIAGKNEGTNIKELGNLQALRGFLGISNLENIANVGDVSEANLKDKKQITCLGLEWCGETDDSAKAREVLDRLQPHTNVQYLIIDNYQGTRFPSWIGHQSFRHIAYVCLVNCRNCVLLPSLGQLPSLKDLFISGLEMVERIGDEFYYCSSTDSSSMITPPFNSLETLSFSRMTLLEYWKECSLMGGDGEAAAFSQLRRLELLECPKINWDCFPHLPSSTTLQIRRLGCQQMVASLQSHQLPWLGELQLQACSDMVSFPPQGGLPSNIHTIYIENCDKLESLAKEGWPSNLKSLRIDGCINLFVDVDSFPEEGQLPPTLTYLGLAYLPKLKSLNGKALRLLFCLEQLTIQCCKELRCLPEEGLPDSLSQLNINEWENHSLSERCQRDKGEDWPKIAHIPRIKIDGKLI